MNNITRLTSIGIPAVIGLGLAWVGFRVISNERKIETRKIELQLQLESKSIRSI